MEKYTSQPAARGPDPQPGGEAAASMPENIAMAVRLVSAAIERGRERAPTRSERMQKNARTIIA